MRFLCILETMWDWEARTSGAGFTEAPNFFCINPRNFSGRRLYRLTGEEPGCLWCTNACWQLVNRPSQHGTPDPQRLQANLDRWELFKAKVLEKRPEETHGVIVCGKVAQETFERLRNPPQMRTIYMPHPANRTWTELAIQAAAFYIQEGTASISLRLNRGKIEARQWR